MAANIIRKPVLVAAVYVLTAVVLAGLFVKILGIFAIMIPLLFMFVDVGYLLRTVWSILGALILQAMQGKRGFLDTSESTFYVLPSDIDYNSHMNNSRYLRECDFARTNHWLGSGFYQQLRKYNMDFVLEAMTIRYRRSVSWFQTICIETKILFWDEKALYLEQKFVNENGFVCAVGIAKQSTIQRKTPKAGNYPITIDQVVQEVYGEHLTKPKPSKELELWMEYNSTFKSKNI